MSLLARMDYLVKVTGLYGITMIERPEPRTLRWIPLVALIAMTLGYGLIVLLPKMTHPASLDVKLGITAVTILLFLGGYLAANFLRFFGPRIVPGSGAALDERDRMIAARARSVSGALLAWATIFACFYFAAARALGFWEPRTSVEWVDLGLTVHGYFLTLPVLVASWLQPRLEGEE